VANFILFFWVDICYLIWLRKLQRNPPQSTTSFPKKAHLNLKKSKSQNIAVQSKITQKIAEQSRKLQTQSKTIQKLQNSPESFNSVQNSPENCKTAQKKVVLTYIPDRLFVFSNNLSTESSTGFIIVFFFLLFLRRVKWDNLQFKLYCRVRKASQKD